MRTRFLTTFLAVTAGFSIVFLLPTNYELAQPRIDPELPTFVGNWFGEPVEVTQAELNALAKDTKFSRRLYTDTAGDLNLQVSIILSGHDMNTSIHRPERCLNAQGWTITSSEDVVITAPTADDPAQQEDVAVMRTHQVKFVDLPMPQESQQTTPAVRRTFGVTSYFFVGADAITNSHWTRTFHDMWRRLATGQNQRWAFVMVSGTYGSYVVPPEGLTPERQQEYDEALAERRVKVEERIDEFLTQLLPQALHSAEA
jgi:hypothetical protein